MCYVTDYIGTEFARGRVCGGRVCGGRICQGPSLLGAEMSRNLSADTPCKLYIYENKDN